MKAIVLLLCTLGSLLAPDSRTTTRFTPPYTVFVGVKLPLNYTAGYHFQFSRRLSVQAEAGLIVAPLDTYAQKTM